MKRPVAIMFANLKGNLGDLAILHAMLKDLRMRFPDHPLHVYAHPFVRIDATAVAAFRLSGAPEFSLISRTYSIRVPAPVKWLSHTRLWSRIQDWYVQKLARRSDRDAVKFSAYEAVAFAGGEQWTGTNPGLTMFGTLAAIHPHNASIHAYPFSIDRSVLRNNGEAALRRYFGTMLRGPVVVRDAASRDMLASLGVNVTWGIDCVFSLRREGGEIDPAAGRDLSRVLLVITGRKGQNEGPLKALIMRLKADNIVVELLSTSPADDRALFSRIGAELDIPVRMPATWQESVAELKASSLIVTNRLHTMIFGTFGDAALLPVTDRVKANALADDMGLPHRAANAGSVTSELVRRAMSDRSAILDRIAAYGGRIGDVPFSPVFDDRQHD